MAINYTSILKLPKPDSATPNWATYMHRLADQVDGMFGKVVTVTKVTGATTLPDADGVADNGKAMHIRSTQTLTGNVQVTVPARNRLFYAENRTSGAFSWKVQTSGGNGVNVPQGKGMWLRSTSTGVIAASRTDGRSTATETGIGIITATHLASNSVTTAQVADASITVAKFAGATSYGQVFYSATSSGFPWAKLARGTSRQVLAMSTAAVSKPVWKTPPVDRVATSTAIAAAALTSRTFTHGLTGLTNKYDIKHVAVWLECQTANNGFSVGECYYLGSCVANSNDNTGFSIFVDSLTSVKIMATVQVALVNPAGSRIVMGASLANFAYRFIVIA